MSEPDKDQKTHDPTQKRLDDARKKGEVLQSPEVRHAAMMVGAAIVIGWTGVSALRDIGSQLAFLWGNAEDFHLTNESARDLTTGLLVQFGKSLAPVFGVLFLSALAIGVLQGPFTFSTTRLTPKWSKISPVSGMKRIFGPRALIEFVKTLAKFCAIAILIAIILRPNLAGIDQLVGYEVGAIGAAAGRFAFEAIRAVAIMVVMLALIDFLYQRRSFLKRMRMSLQQIKDEHKQSDGDPLIKSRIRQIQMQRSRSRMMAAVPEASVVITNPTHYAIALKYDHGEMAAPVVVAKGVDAVAFRIREAAYEAKVPVVEAPPLARALYAAVDLDHPVPVEHYAAVAEIIGYVMRLARQQHS